MLFYSTNHKSQPVPFREAVLKGLADDGGLFLPSNIPQFPTDLIAQLHSMSFQEVSYEVAKRLIGEEIPESIIQNITEEAINFRAPLVRLSNGIYVLELFHGPTLAFKDFGARFMARILAYLVRGEKQRLNILVATSGDTGSAVAHAFYGVSGIRVILLYPAAQVSEIQEKQMTTLGGNIVPLEIQGTFDDCQRLVKEAFLDKDLQPAMSLTSANSINIARLIPQCFYYFHLFNQLEDTNIAPVISVPSGNFGNLTAGILAKRMGLPVSKFVASTNQNAVVPDYLRTGIFKPRTSIATISNAMDVGNPSNFHRMLELYSGDAMEMRKDLEGASFSDVQTRAAIQELFQRHKYLCDPHGAVAYLGLKKHLSEAKNRTTGIFLETAHPAKFLDVMGELVPVKIEIPERLRICLSKTKQSIPISRRFEDLKSYLMSL